MTGGVSPLPACRLFGSFACSISKCSDCRSIRPRATIRVLRVRTKVPPGAVPIQRIGEQRVPIQAGELPTGQRPQPSGWCAAATQLLRNSPHRHLRLHRMCAHASRRNSWRPGPILRSRTVRSSQKSPPLFIYLPAGSRLPARHSGSPLGPAHAIAACRPRERIVGQRGISSAGGLYLSSSVRRTHLSE